MLEQELNETSPKQPNQSLTVPQMGQMDSRCSFQPTQQPFSDLHRCKHRFSSGTQTFGP